jgi:hypothetical protein
MLKRYLAAGSPLGLMLLLAACSSVVYLDTARVVPEDQYGWGVTLVPLEFAHDSATRPMAFHPVLIPSVTFSYGIEPKTEIFARTFSVENNVVSYRDIHGFWNYWNTGGAAVGGKYQYVSGPIDFALFMQGAVPIGNTMSILEGNYAIGGGPIVSCEEPGRFPFTVGAQALYAGNLGFRTAYRFFSYAQASAGVPIRLGNRRQFRILPGVSFYVPLANNYSQAERQEFMPFTIQFGLNFAYPPGLPVDE